MLVTQLFPDCRVIDTTADDVIKFGLERKWFFEVMDEKGVLEKPILKPKFHYIPRKVDNTTIPPEGLKRLAAVTQQFSILQVIIGHEIEEKKEERSSLDNTAPMKKIPSLEVPAFVKDIPWAEIATVGVGIAGGILLGVMQVVLMIDPKLIVVLDNEEKTWVCLYSWEELPARS